MKTKTLIHYLVSLILQLTLIIVLVSVLSFLLVHTMNGRDGSVITFVTSLVSLLIIVPILTLSLTGFKNPLKIIMPIIISVIIMASFITIIEIGTYEWNGKFQTIKEETGKNSIKLILIFIFSIITTFVLLFWLNIYATMFIMVSTTSNRSDEWEVINFLKLFLTRSKIYHLKNFSYLTNDSDKLMIIKFITDDVIERKINFEYKKITKRKNEDDEEIVEEKTIKASEEIVNLQNAIKKTNKVFDIDVTGVIAYISNILPEVSGEETNNIKIIKNKSLFEEYKKIEKTNKNLNFIEEKEKLL